MDAKVIKFDVTRTDFEQGCSVLFDRALAPVSRLLGELGKSTLINFSSLGCIARLACYCTLL
jgi:hypothetical protein